MKTLSHAFALPYSVCIGCGCHDRLACTNDDTGGACWWLAVDKVAKLGVCSECSAHLARWQRDDRALSDHAKAALALHDET
jgi:hypothetical protein